LLRIYYDTKYGNPASICNILVYVSGIFRTALFLFMLDVVLPCRFRWPRGLRCRSASALLWGLRVRIPPGHGGLSLVSVVCCQVEVCTMGRSLVQRSSTKCYVSECVLETSVMKRLRTTRASKHKKKIGSYLRPQ
jgi:hypothetical protein